MEIFIDTASLHEIKQILPWGIITGVTTNQKIFSREKGINFKDRVMEILSIVDAPLSIEVTKTRDADEVVLAEAREYVSWNPKNIIIKIPMWGNGRGLTLANKLHSEGIRTNVTCIITSNQSMLAALAGATYVSIFFCRIRDAGGDPVRVIQVSKRIIDESKMNTKVIVGSIRNQNDVAEAATAGADIITITPEVLLRLPFHQKSEDTIAEFDNAWAEFRKFAPALRST